MKRILAIALLLAACSPHWVTPVPHPANIAPKIAPPTATELSLMPTITPEPTP